MQALNTARQYGDGTVAQANLEPRNYLAVKVEGESAGGKYRNDEDAIVLVFESCVSV